MFRDPRYGARQEAFRVRLRDSGITTATVTSSDGLEVALLHALAALPAPVPRELAELNTLAAAHGEQVFLDALARAVAFGRWRAADVRSILAAGTGTPQPTMAGDALDRSRSCRHPVVDCR